MYNLNSIVANWLKLGCYCLSHGVVRQWWSGIHQPFLLLQSGHSTNREEDSHSSHNHSPLRWDLSSRDGLWEGRDRFVFLYGCTCRWATFVCKFVSSLFIPFWVVCWKKMIIKRIAKMKERKWWLVSMSSPLNSRSRLQKRKNQTIWMRQWRRMGRKPQL